MTKKELQRMIPSVRFSGKEKKVYVSASAINHIKTIALNEFCLRTNSTWVTY